MSYKWQITATAQSAVSHTEHAPSTALTTLTAAVDTASADLTDNQAAATVAFLRRTAAALRDYAGEPLPC